MRCRTYALVEATRHKYWHMDWEDLRIHKLTASTFASAVGFWPDRRIQLWLEKIGAIEPFSGNDATRWSNVHGKVALEKYRLITGNTIYFPTFNEYYLNKTSNDWLAGSADGVIEHSIYGLPYDGILEIKCPYFGGKVMKGKIRKCFPCPWFNIPVHYMPQAQGLMEILDKNWMDFYCWTPNGSSLFRIRRDMSYWNVLKVALSDFWYKHVQPAKDICMTCPIQDPIRQLSFLKPAPKHELFERILFSSNLLVNESELLLDFNVLVGMLTASGVAAELDATQSGPGFTLFAPTDEAFGDLGDVGSKLQGLPAEQKAMVLRYHALHSFNSLASIRSLTNPAQKTLATESSTSAGYTLNITGSHIGTGIVDAELGISVKEMPPAMAIFSISKVLLPPEIFG